QEAVVAAGPDEVRRVASRIRRSGTGATVDSLGITIPEDMLAVFAGPLRGELRKQLQVIQRSVDAAAREPGGEFLKVHAFKSTLKSGTKSEDNILVYV